MDVNGSGSFPLVFGAAEAQPQRAAVGAPLRSSSLGGTGGPAPVTPPARAAPAEGDTPAKGAPRWLA
eukprot:10764237-Lingulodinium_polyedra.AAC.1